MIRWLAAAAAAAAAAGGGEAGEKAWCEAPARSLTTHDLSGPAARAVRPQTKPARSSPRAAAGPPRALRRPRRRFVVAMMGPRVGSKMVRSMLEGWGGHGAVYAGGEKQEAALDARFGARRDPARKLDRFFGAAPEQKDPRFPPTRSRRGDASDEATHREISSGEARPSQISAASRGSLDVLRDPRRRGLRADEARGWL